MGLAVLLPGLDGQADLRTGFATAMAPEFEVDLVSYSIGTVLDYEELTEFVLRRLPRDRPFLLIGESFSGPIAINLAAMRPAGLIGLVLCASFAKAPRPLLAPFRHLAVALPLGMLPMPVFMAIMMGRWSNRAWSRRLRIALMKCDSAVLHRRLVSAAVVDVTGRLSSIECPVLYIQASRDRVVLPYSWAAIHAAISHARCTQVDAPHMLLQAKPFECATAVKGWYSRMG